jgi:fatty acid desaturase
LPAPSTSANEFFLRQIVGSVNYACGNDRIDFLQGWLNYQIEHHLWPAMPLLQYQRAQPRVREICEKHGVPYKQESIWTRVRKNRRHHGRQGFTADVGTDAASRVATACFGNLRRG